MFLKFWFQCFNYIKFCLYTKYVGKNHSNRYNCYVIDIYCEGIKNQPDNLLEKLSNYHPNAKIKIEVNHTKFLDTHIMSENGIIETSVAV